ncbi:MAG: HEAT repeat domain-containing protein [Bacteroidota bacterium]
MKSLSEMINRILVLLCVLLAGGGVSFGQEAGSVATPSDSLLPVKTKIYTIQIAASKVFIKPSYFKDKYTIHEDVRYFQKDGWYKYIIGNFKSNKEATAILTSLDFPAFVTYYWDTLVPSKKVPVFADSSEIEQDSAITLTDSLALTIPDSVRKEQYVAKIREADSVFYTVRDLVLARSLYHEAVLLDPVKNYPKDQILEIDRQISETNLKPLITRLPVAVYAILFFVGIMILVLSFVLSLRTRRRRIDRKRQQLKDEYQDSITEFLFTETDTVPESLLKQDTKVKKQILIDEIMQLYANLAGEISEKLRKLYLDAGLDNESVKKARSSQWHIRAKGFRELAQMNVQTVTDEIDKCLNSSNEVLRMEAQLALIRLNTNDPFGFLDKLVQPFTSWEQLHVYEIIQRYQIIPPDFSRWLDSPNESIIVFSIRMIRAFRQESAFPKLSPLLEHPSYDIREETFITLGELGNPEALNLLKDRFRYESEPGRIEILKAIGKIPDDSNIEFLKGVLEPRSDLSLEAAEALVQIDSFGMKGIDNMLSSSDEDMQAIARHILDNKMHR